MNVSVHLSTDMIIYSFIQAFDEKATRDSPRHSGRHKSKVKEYYTNEKVKACKHIVYSYER